MLKAAASNVNIVQQKRLSVAGTFELISSGEGGGAVPQDFERRKKYELAMMDVSSLSLTEPEPAGVPDNDVPQPKKMRKTPAMRDKDPKTGAKVYAGEAMEVMAVLDPLSKTAQRLVPLMMEVR